MRWPICTAALALTAGSMIWGHAQTPPRPGDPSPGTRGNPDNIPLIGRRDPKGNPVRLARATGHVSNYSEEKVRPYTLPDPLVMASGDRVTDADLTPLGSPVGITSDPDAYTALLNLADRIGVQIVDGGA